MKLGYMRVSKAGRSQVNDLQRDALRKAGVSAAHLYEDAASGKRDDRPGLAVCGARRAYFDKEIRVRVREANDTVVLRGLSISVFRRWELLLGASTNALFIQRGSGRFEPLRKRIQHVGK